MKNEMSAKLIELIKQNPALPVRFFVDSQVVEDEGYNYWLGDFKDCYVCEYACYNDRFYFYEDKDELEEAYYDYNEDYYISMCEEDINRDISERTKDMWEKAIIVYIGV